MHPHAKRFVDGTELIGGAFRVFPAGDRRHPGIFGKSAIHTETEKFHVQAVQCCIRLAVVAFAAEDMRLRRNQVSFLEVGNRIAHFHYLATGFMAEYDGQFHHAHYARRRVVGMDIAATDAGGFHFYQDIFRPDVGHVNVFVLKSRRIACFNQCFHPDLSFPALELSVRYFIPLLPTEKSPVNPSLEFATGDSGYFSVYYDMLVYDKPEIIESNC